jgi:flavin reductase (DIM6/NTAB) family NADH-FMN oxidoreductase RutF
MMETDLGEQFRASMRRFPSTVSVISTAKDGRRHGMTATAVTSVSLNPPSLLVCVNRSGRLFGIMESCHRFCVNVLHAEHVAVSRNFAEPNCPDRFAYGEWHDNEHGIPYLLDAQVAMSCVKSLLVPYGSHTVFFGNVEEIKIRDDISTLLYQNGDYGVFQPLAREGDASLAQLVGWG